MAEMDEACQFSLMSLEEELTCSICLSPFHCPVTIPCGHNFCQDCLLATWKDSSYSCPQCRTAFSTQPELKKNTVLSTVVETFNLRSNKSEGRLSTEESKAPAVAVVVVRCDACMEAEASQTCLTCMASFCEEHLRPHRDNPVFRLHQLSEPLGDLMERICPDHHKLMELYCSQHGRPICSLCLQQVHKGCPFKTPEEQRNLKESDLRGKLSLLDGKITKNENIVSQMSDMQNKLKDSATDRKKTLAAEYQQMRDILAREEQDAVTAVDRELESGQTKLKTFLKKFTDNINSIGKAKEDIHGLLSQSHTLAFLQDSYDLPAAANVEPFTPRISLDSKKVIATQAFASALKEYLTEVLKQPVEARQRMLKPELNTDNVAPDMKAGPVPENTSTQPDRDPKERRNPRSHSPGRPPINPLFRPAPGQSYGGPPAGWYPPHHAQGEGPPFAPGYGPMNHGPYPGPGPQWHPGPRFPGPHGPGVGNQPNTGPKKRLRPSKKASQTTEANKGKMKGAGSKENLLDLNQQRCGTPESESKERPETPDIPPDITSAEKRSELLKYGTVLSLNAKTAHRRIELSEGLTKATVSDEHTDYPEHASRFAVCSQVLASKGFSRGRHYWEVRMSSNNFIGIGLAYSSIDRKGPTSRLGRNAQSWCVEWFNVKLSAWHDSKENVLVNPNSKRVGVLLDCEGGTATFYNIMGQMAYPFHSFVFPFAEAVFPAFWIFSSGSSIALCKLQA